MIRAARPGVDVALVGVDQRPRGDRPPDQGADRRLLDVGQHPDDDLAATPDHPEDRRLLLCQGPTIALPLQASSPGRPPFSLTASRWPWRPPCGMPRAKSSGRWS